MSLGQRGQRSGNSFVLRKNLHIKKKSWQMLIWSFSTVLTHSDIYPEKNKILITEQDNYTSFNLCILSKLRGQEYLVSTAFRGNGTEQTSTTLLSTFALSVDGHCDLINNSSFMRNYNITKIKSGICTCQFHVLSITYGSNRVILTPYNIWFP